MGTNYYLKCKCCGTEYLHIGKQSAGWNFSSDYSEADIKEKLADNQNLQITDEYKREYTWESFRARITQIWEKRESTGNQMDWS